MNLSVEHKNDKLPLEKHKELNRTLIVDLSKNFGGANARVLGLMSKLPRGQVMLAALQDSPVAVEAERAGVKVFIVGKNKNSLNIIPQLVSVIRREKIRLLDTQNPQSKFWGSIAAKLTGTTLISTLNSWYGSEHGAGSLRGVFYSMLELGTNFALERYIVVSKSVYTALVKRGIDPNKIDLIYNAVELDRAQPTGALKQFVESFKLPNETILLAAAGRLTWAKGYEDLFGALEILVKEDGRIRCLIAGDGELREQLQLKIEAANLSQHVILLGHLSRENVLSLIQASDVFVMPSRSEGTPIALLEAAMLRKPIVATSVGGIPELLNNEEECLLVESGNLLQLANGIRRLIQDKALSEWLRENAYRRVLRDFSLDAQVRATIQSYNRALQLKNKQM